MLKILKIILIFFFVVIIFQISILYIGRVELPLRRRSKLWGRLCLRWVRLKHVKTLCICFNHLLLNLFEYGGNWHGELRPAIIITLQLIWPGQLMQQIN